MKSLWLKIAGVAGIIGGSVALYVSGTSETTVGAIVAGVFVLAGVVVSIFKPGSDE
ncbi:MAG: hypothetical protein ACOC3V_00010 [bacterium]